MIDDMFTRIVKPDEAIMPYVVAAAASDKHAVVGCSHVVMRAGHVIGYLSFATVPVLNVWMHSQEAKPRDTMAVANFIENLASQMGHSAILLPCNADSPYFKALPSLGYEETTIEKCFNRTKLFIKKV